jgi:predicted transcriptional regulator
VSGGNNVISPPLGDQELEIYRYVDGREPVAGRDVAEHFAEEKGLSRSTVLTVLERLRNKGYLSRRRSDGVYMYSTKVERTELLHNLVGSFVEKTLGGSVSPVVAYLAKTRKLTAQELTELRELVDELKADREVQQ